LRKYSFLLSPSAQVSYYTLGDKGSLAAPGSPTTTLHHAVSYLSVATSSDSEAEPAATAEPEPQAVMA
jgi:hypothetical protein